MYACANERTKAKRKNLTKIIWPVSTKFSAWHDPPFLLKFEYANKSIFLKFWLIGLARKNTKSKSRNRPIFLSKVINYLQLIFPSTFHNSLIPFQNQDGAKDSLFAFFLIFHLPTTSSLFLFSISSNFLNLSLIFSFWPTRGPVPPCAPAGNGLDLSILFFCKTVQDTTPH